MLVAVLASSASAACSREGAPRSTALPDRVVLVTIDTLRADHVGCYGANRAHTPNMDAIAARGVRFDHAVSPAPLTLPSHTSLMTSLDPPRHGVRHNSIFALDAGLPTLAGHLSRAGFATAAVVSAAVLDARFGLGNGFAHYDDDIAASRRSGAVGFAERPADAAVDAAVRWLDQAPDRFFLWVHLYDPHSSYQPPPGFASAFASDLYAGEIAFADAQLGRLLGEIERRWGTGGLLVAVTSDHGEALGEHGEITHAYTIYEATQRVPLLIAGPGVPEGLVVDSLAALVDVAPTLLALAGAEPLPGANGRDLTPLLAAAAGGAGSDGGPGPTPASAPPTAYMETVATQLDHGWSPLLAIRGQRWKLIRAPRPELFDLSSDPSETRNLIGEHPDEAQRLDELLSARLAGARAPLAAISVPESERLKLESLGYIVPALPAADPAPSLLATVTGASESAGASESDGGDAEPAATLGVVGGVDPKDRIGVLSTLAEVYGEISAGRNEAALEMLIALGDRGHLVASTRAAVALAVGRLDIAERDARSVLREQPTRPDLLTILGKAEAAQGRHAEAARAFGVVAALDPTSPGPQLVLAHTLERAGDRRAAIEAYREAQRRDPARQETRWRLAALLLESGRRAEADEVLRALPQSSLDEPRVALRLALAEARAGSHERALGRVTRSLDAHPDDPRLRRRASQLSAAAAAAP